MVSTEKERIYGRIEAFGFEPFPCPTEQPDINPGRIVPPFHSPDKVDPEKWLSINQVAQLAGKVPKTIYRWEEKANWLHFTLSSKGSNRDDDLHYIYKDDFLSYLSDINTRNISYLDDSLMNQVSHIMSNGIERGTDSPSHVTDRHPIKKEMSKGVSSDLKSVLQSDQIERFSLALSAQMCQAMKPELRKERVLWLAGAGAIAGVLLVGFGFLVGLQRGKIEQQLSSAQEAYSRELQMVTADLKDRLDRIEEVAKEGRDSVWIVEKKSELPLQKED